MLYPNTLICQFGIFMFTHLISTKIYIIIIIDSFAIPKKYLFMSSFIANFGTVYQTQELNRKRH